MACVITEENISTVKKITFAWTSAANQTATGTTINAYSGEIIRMVTIPGAAPNAPIALYDVVINDEDNTDVLMGGGADRSATALEQVAAANLGIVANDKLSLAIANAGASKTGTVIIYIR